MSGRPRKFTGVVEDMFSIKISDLLRLPTASDGFSIKWVFESSGEMLFAIGVKLVRSSRSVLFVFDSPLDGCNVRQEIALTSTQPYFGGQRWWFRCSPRDDETGCNRRCAVLYLSPVSDRFGCRQCLDLTYSSTRLSHRYDALFRYVDDLTARVRHLP